MAANLVTLDHKKAGEAERWLLAQYHKHVVGQERAVSHLVRAIIGMNSCDCAFRSPEQPAGIFFFLGTPGVGKTLIAEVTAEIAFGDRRALTKINCAELQQSHEVSRLIGSPPGYIGHGTKSYFDQGKLDAWGLKALRAQSKLDEIDRLSKALEKIQGLMKGTSPSSPKYQKFVAAAKSLHQKLTAFEAKRDAFREANPEGMLVLEDNIPGGCFSIVLLDEIEKAHQDVLKVFLNIFDKASLKVNRVRNDENESVLFHNTLFFCTSNIAGGEIRKYAQGKTYGFAPPSSSDPRDRAASIEQMRQQIYHIGFDEMQRKFPSEFIDRIGKEYVFALEPATPEAATMYLDTMLMPAFTDELSAASSISLRCSPAAIAYIVEEAFGKTGGHALGMRAVNRVFKVRIKEPLANLAGKSVAEGGIVRGDSVLVDAELCEGVSGLVFRREERSQEPERAIKKAPGKPVAFPPETLLSQGTWKQGRYIAPFPFFMP